VTSVPSYHWALGLAVALANAFLVGRSLSRETESQVRKPGLRDCLLFSLGGALASVAAQPLLTASLLFSGTLILAVARWQNQAPRGLTSELAVLLCFLLGYLSLTQHLALAAATGIISAALLAEKKSLHHFATSTLSDAEFTDTLKFLAIVFIIYPLLPAGTYGPYGFFEPRKIWFFIILVSAVSYFGYFFAKYFSEKNGRLLTAILGGLASTTAYTGAASKMVAETPSIAIPMVRATLLANAIMFPRMFILIAVIDRPLALLAAPVLLVMTASGLLASWWLGRSGERPAVTQSRHFSNPFALRPALQFGLLFTAVLFITRVGGRLFDHDSQWITGFIGGLLDVDAVVLSFGEACRNGHMSPDSVVGACVLAGLANALFKSSLAFASRQNAFSFRLIAGFALIFGTGGLALVLL
jgi:uncharacterized membrane protein (DUF4010 family)